MKHIKDFKLFILEYNSHVVADSTTMNDVPVRQQVDISYFGTDVEMDEKEPPNPTGRNDRETKNKTKKAVAKISAS